MDSTAKTQTEKVLVQQVLSSKCQAGAKKQVVDAREKILYFISRGGKEVQKLL